MNKFKITFPMLCYVVILALGFTAYSNSFTVPFQFDDALYISENPLITNPDFFTEPSKFCEKAKLSEENKNRCSTLKRRFVGQVTFALNYRLHHMQVHGYHAVNLIIHLINAILLFIFVRLVLRIPFFSETVTPRTENLTALLTSLIFVSHPVQTQAVTYIAQRFTSLVTLFYLLSFVGYARWRTGRTGAWRIAFYAISLISSVLAMWTKEIAFTLPVMLVLFEFMFFEGAEKRRVLHLVPFLLTMVIIPMNLIEYVQPFSDFPGDAGNWKVLTDISRWDYLLTQFTVIATYIRLIFLPVNQNVDYDYPVYHSLFVPEVLLSFLLLVTVLGMGIYLLARYGRREPRVRLIAFGIFWFFIALSVESSIIPIVDLIFEHRVYLPSAGAFAALSTALFVIAEKIKARWPWAMKATVGVSALVVVILAGGTYARNRVWQDEVALWEDVVRKSPNNVRGLSNLGLSFQQKKQFDMALSVYDKVIAKDPFHYKVYNNRGMVYSEIGEHDKAIKDFTIAISIYPDIPEPYQNRGTAYVNKGEHANALNDFSKVIAISPYGAEAYNARGTVHGALGNMDAAIEDFTNAISLVPNFFGFYKNRGLAFSKKGEFEAAIRDFTEAISLNPLDEKTFVLRGSAFFADGKIDMAMLDFAKACEMGSSEACEALKSGLSHTK